MKLSVLAKPLKSEGFKKYARNTGWLFAEQILRILSGILVGVWTARYLGPESFGIYSYAISFVALFGVIANLGLQSITVRELLNFPDQQKPILGTAFYLQIIGALFTVLLICVVLPITSNNDQTNIYILIIASGLFFQAFQVIDSYFQSQVLAKYISICRLVQLFISAVLKVVFVLTEADLIYFVLIILIDNLTLALTLSFAYWKKGNHTFYKSWHISKARYLLKESWPLMVSGLVVMVYMKIDQIMIKEMMNTTAVGIYSAAMRLSEAWYFVPMLISQSLFPAILSAKKSDEVLYKLRLQRLLNLMMFFSLVIAIIFTFLSDWIINFLYGPSFDGAGDILSIQVWAGVAVSSGVVSSNWFLIEGLQKYSMYRTSVGAVINVILNLILIPLYGIAGSAVATLISQFVASVLLNAFFPSTRVIFKLQTRAILGIGLLGNREPV